MNIKIKLNFFSNIKLNVQPESLNQFNVNCSFLFNVDMSCSVITSY